MATTIGHLPSTSEVRSLIRCLLRTARRFPDYNIREYVKRRTIEGVKQNQELSDPSAISCAFTEGKSQLEVASRQAVVYSLYAPNAKSIMEIAIKLYRSLLRAVRIHIGSDGSKTHFRDYVVGEFRKNIGLEDASLVQQKLKLAQNYILLLNSVHHHKDLLFSYNIAVNREGELKSTLRKSAASVGLQIPKPYEE